ncbi:MAG TPA: hypothetical protein VFR47_14370 [Anaerolineales bacterium]|nr:hypothetical protein [Anaerolineales bacterium]
MTSKKASLAPIAMKPNWTYYVLIALIVEKIIQHTVVTLAFYFNWKEIASTVVVSPVALMILGAVVGVLFALSLWGLTRKQTWAIKLVLVLAVFDILGEFVAQGKLGIVITVSFIVAVFLLILAWQYQRQLHATPLLPESPFGTGK